MRALAARVSASVPCHCDEPPRMHALDHASCCWSRDRAALPQPVREQSSVCYSGVATLGCTCTQGTNIFRQALAACQGCSSAGIDRRTISAIAVYCFCRGLTDFYLRIMESCLNSQLDSEWSETWLYVQTPFAPPTPPPNTTTTTVSTTTTTSPPGARGGVEQGGQARHST